MLIDVIDLKLDSDHRVERFDAVGRKIVRHEEIDPVMARLNPVGRQWGDTAVTVGHSVSDQIPVRRFRFAAVEFQSNFDSFSRFPARRVEYVRSDSAHEISFSTPPQAAVR